MGTIQIPDDSWPLDKLAEFVVKHGKKTAADAWLIGKAFLSAKKQHPSGFVQWLKQSCHCSVATAYRYMTVASRMTFDEVRQMTLWEAYEKLASPSKPQGPSAQINRVRRLADFVNAAEWKQWSEPDRHAMEAALRKLYDVLENIIEPQFSDAPASFIGGISIPTMRVETAGVR